ncbi:MAG: trypsin-like peptidase domain-containing protein [Chloroflexota bacterium]|nr:trypsin-like peptidase domain-containing protein [Chloroflexota bacterium]
MQETYERIYSQVNPSVVNIRVAQNQEMLASGGSGSGFVWDTDGHIVTNNHVVTGAERITVTFSDGTIVTAKMVGADPDSDLAVVKVDAPADQLQPVRLADSTQVKVGQIVAAIGSPFALESTMTTGIVSAVGRFLPVDASSAQGPSYTIPDVIQTDAAINPGNSGGVLVDQQGQVIGVTSAIISPVRASAGIGFAIPSAIVQQVVPALIKDGRYVHPWLGIAGTTLTPDLAKAMSLAASQRGALVVAVLPDSPASQAGLKGSASRVAVEGQEMPAGGDVIVALDEKPVKTFDDVVSYLSRYGAVGKTMSLTILRNGERQAIQITPAARPQSDRQRATPQQPTRPPAQPARRQTLGIMGQTISPAIAEAMRLPSGTNGVLVTEVISGSAAERAGLRGGANSIAVEGQRIRVGGDIVVALDGQPTPSIEELQALLQKRQPGQKVTLTLLRNGESLQVDVTLGERSRLTP